MCNTPVHGEEVGPWRRNVQRGRTEMVTTTVGIAARVHTNTGCGVLSLGGGETLMRKCSRLGRGSEWAVWQIVLSTADFREQARIRL